MLTPDGTGKPTEFDAVALSRINRISVILTCLATLFPSALSRAQTSSQTPRISLVANAANGSATIAPNTWVEIKGAGLAPLGDSRIWQGSDFANNQLPTQLDGVSVTMNGKDTYVYYISPTQVNVLTPPDLTPGTVQVELKIGGVTGAAFMSQGKEQSPSFFVFGASPYVVGTHANGSDVGPATLYPGVTTPARPGELVVLYANGFGATTPPITKGSELQSGTLPVMPVIQIGGVSAVVQSAGLISPGLYQLNVVVPLSAASGGNAVTAQYSGQNTQTNVLLTVQALSLSVSDSIIPVGQSTTLTWSSMNATSCSASDSWSGSVPNTGTQSITPVAAGYYTYTLACTSSGVTSSQSVTLTAYGSTPSVRESSADDAARAATFYVAPPNQIVALRTSLTVPPKPPAPTIPGAALYLWPGLDPATSSLHFLPINNGVLQPVLSWGPSCAPTSQPKPFSSWWISAQYVNTIGKDPGYMGCFSGSSILVNPGDVLLIEMTLDAKTRAWNQVVTDSTTSQSVTFNIDLKRQGQNYAYFAIEAWYGAVITTPVIFSNTTITFQSPDTDGWCSTSRGEENGYVMTPPTPRKSGRQCFIASIVLNQ
jgi:uncharacterized protein (TIGR03437 family)